jgi:hypothetical protein
MVLADAPRAVTAAEAAIPSGPRASPLPIRSPIAGRSLGAAARSFVLCFFAIVVASAYST